MANKPSKKKKRSHARFKAQRPAASRSDAVNRFLGRVVVAGLFITIGLFCWSVYVDFVPSPFWENLSLKISLELAAIFTLMFYWALWTGRIDVDQFDGYGGIFAVVVSVPLVLFFALWFSLERGGGDLANRMIGERDQARMMFELGKYDPEDECQKMAGIEEGTKTPVNFCLSYKLIVYDKGNLPQKFRANISTKRSRFGRQLFKLDGIGS